ncbi:MAG TPA: spore coat protein [Firmicutes bacterium]|nr:spore coat protein [Bacillota bacterium]
MNDKDIASDMLNSVKQGVQMFTLASIEAANPQLRQTLLNLRNQCEQTQWQLFELSRANNWYQPAPQADPQYMQQLARTYQQGMQAQATMGVGTGAGAMAGDMARRV